MKREMKEKIEQVKLEFKNGWFKRHKKLIFGALAITTVSGITFIGITNYVKHNIFEIIDPDDGYYSVSDFFEYHVNADKAVQNIKVLTNRTDITKDTKLKLIGKIIK